MGVRRKSLHGVENPLGQLRRTMELDPAFDLTPGTEVRFLAALMDNLPDNIYFKDAHSRFVRVNRAMARYLGLEDASLAIGKSDFDYFATEHAEQAFRDEQEVMRTGTPMVGKDEREIWPDGTVRWVSTTKLPLRDHEDRIVGTFGISRDITARKEAEMQLYERAFYDPLTRLPNRALFLDRLNHVLRRSRRRGDHVFAVLFLDLDRFKGINDSLGHLVGDELLVSIARRLEGCLRPGDTVARLGGDEFTVLLDGIRDEDDAVQIASRILREMALPFRVAGHELFTTTSIGIALGATTYERPEDILRDADTAMYQAKNDGRARHAIFRVGMHDRVTSILKLETELRQALSRDEFRLFYQPVVDVGSGRIVAFEALLRWMHPTRGLVSPDDFISLAEETGLICPIGIWGLAEASRQRRAWHERFGGERTLAMHANISPRQFAEPTLLDDLRHVLKSTAVEPRALILELTESALLHDVSIARQLIDEMRSLGVRIVIDDFGMGYSSLAQLERFPVDGLKIDRSFTSRVGSSVKATEIVRGIVNLGRNVGLDVTAEGVETPEQLARIESLECHRVQGYLFAKPVPAEEASVLIATQPWRA